MADHTPRSTLTPKEYLTLGKGGETSHDFHQGLHQDLASGSSSVALALAIVLVRLLSWLPPYRVIMVWVYEHTNGSLLVAILMHVSLISSSIILLPPLAVVANLISGYATAAVLWVIVAVIALANHGYLSQQPPLRRQVA